MTQKYKKLPVEAFQRALQEKQATRRRLEALPFEEKYNLLIAIQKRSAQILATRGIQRRVWPPL